MPKGVWLSTIKPLLAKGKKIIQEGSLLSCYESSGKLLASVSCVDPKLTSLVQKGLEECSSLTAHKLLRWQILTGFNAWIERREDPRLIPTAGGYEGIARLIGCGSSHKAIGVVKALLHAQAYARFSFYDGSQGNLIILREVERHRNGEPSKINMVLGELLLPNYTHLLPKGEKRRLIPIPKLPPLIGSNNTHSAQAFLQLLFLEEFSDQSRIFSEKGYAYFPWEKWLELGLEAGISKASLPRVVNGWLEHGFLEKDETQKDGSVLGEAYFQLTGFLQDQGALREKGSRIANRSKKKAFCGDRRRKAL